MSLRDLLTETTLPTLTDSRSLVRGKEYFADGLVSHLAEHTGKVVADVSGTHTYRVALWAEDDEIGFSCTCPVGDEGAFCKHCVAVALAWLNQQDIPPSASSQGSLTLDDARSYLASLEKEALVELLMERALEDSSFRQSLLMKAARRSPKGMDLGTYRHALQEAFRHRGFVEYGEAYGYARGIEDVIDSIEELLEEDRYATAVMDLADYGLKQTEKALEHVDDSDGNMGGVFERLQQLHHAACVKATPDPKALAEYLFHWEMKSGWDTFLGASGTYAELLGEKGLARYRQLAEEAWAKIPQLQAGDNRSHEGGRFRITHIMMGLARQSGDVETLVQVMARDLSSAYSYLKFAEAYQKADKADAALGWAERGVKAFPVKTDSRLRTFLLEEYHRRNRSHDAMALAWAEFTDWLNFDRYVLLKDQAEKCQQWREWREKALIAIRKSIGANKQKKSPSPFWPLTVDHSLLVQIFLWEGDPDAAWHEATEGGCNAGLWLQLAEKREADHPEDALTVYRARVEPTVDQKNNEAYVTTVGFLRKIHLLPVRLNRKSEFDDYLAEIRVKHQPKRNFMKLLDAEKWR